MEQIYINSEAVGKLKPGDIIAIGRYNDIAFGVFKKLTESTIQFFDLWTHNYSGVESKYRVEYLERLETGKTKPETSYVYVHTISRSNILKVDESILNPLQKKYAKFYKQFMRL